MRPGRKGLAAVTLFASLMAHRPAPASAEQPPPRDTRSGRARAAGTSVLGGTVLSAEEAPRPLRRVLVTLSGTGLPANAQTVTDDAGRFGFAQLAAGRYTLTAEKPAFVKTFYGSKRAGRGPATPLVLDDGQRMSDVKIGLMRGAVIEGTIFDEKGLALSNAQVRAQQRTIVNGELKFVNPAGPVQLATSDDRGRYRLYGLPPGEYAVRSNAGGSLVAGARTNTPAEIEDAERGSQPAAAVASGAPDAVSGAPVTRIGVYFPGVADAAQAEIVTLRAGEERTGVDIVSRLVRSSRIDGMAVGPAGQPIQNIMVGVANVSTGSLWTSPGAVRPGADGRFSVGALTPGRWLFFGRASDGDPASSGRDAELPLWTSTEVLVNEEAVVEALLRFLPGVRVSGRLLIDASASPPDLRKFRLALVPVPLVVGASVSLPPTTPSSDGAFAFDGVAPGRYRLTLSAAAPWLLRSATVGGADVLDVPLEVRPGGNVDELRITLTDRPTELSGRLYDHLERLAPEYAIVVFSTNRAHWLNAPRRVSGVVRVGSDGRFVVRGLPAGEYFLTALSDLDPSQLSDPAVLDLLAASSMKLTLGDGEQKVQDLKLPGG